MKNRTMFLSAILLLPLASCGDDLEVLNKFSGIPVECSFEVTALGLADTYLSIKDKKLESVSDGNYRLNVNSKYENGSYKVDKLISMPYVKKGDSLAPKFPINWSLTPLTPEQSAAMSGNPGRSSCIIKSIDKDVKKK